MDECSCERWDYAMMEYIPLNGKITLKGIVDEDFVNYKVPSMTLEFPKCTFKCGGDYCQNSALAKEKDITVSINSICRRYLNNPITQAIVCQGLEPMDSFNELHELIWTMRVHFDCFDDIVIYTGYDKEEIKAEIRELKYWSNIIIKYGRFIPDQEPHYDEILGVKLASDNQYAERIN